MPYDGLSPVARHLNRLAGTHQTETDRQLMARFASEQDQLAFAELVRRHGGLVLATCKRILGHTQDAEDAFQATFLVIAKKAGSVSWNDSVAGWLHAVAIRLSHKVRTGNARRQALAAKVTTVPPNAHRQPEPDEALLSAAIDDEIRRLPKEYSEVVLLCAVEGLSTPLAAARLGVSDGAVRGRLYRGREMLRTRLTERGIEVSAVALVGFLSQVASASLPARSVEQLVQAAVSFAAGQSTTGLVSTSATLLATRMMTTMFLTRIGIAIVATATMLLATTGVALTYTPTDTTPAKPVAEKPIVKPVDEAAKNEDDIPNDAKKDTERVEATIVKVDAAKNQLVCGVQEEGGKREYTFELKSGAKVHYAKKPASLNDAKSRMRAVMIVEKKTGTIVLDLELLWPDFEANVTAADGAKGSVSVEIVAQNEEKFVNQFELQKDARVLIDGIPAGVDDLVGSKARFTWAIDKKSFIVADAESATGDLFGTIIKMDYAAGTVEIMLKVNGRHNERKVILNLPLDKTARIRLLGKDVPQQEILPKMPVRLKLQNDHRTVVGLWADSIPTGKDENDED